MLSLASLLKLTKPESIKLSAKCRVRITRAVYDTDEKGYHKMVLATVRSAGSDKDRFAIIQFYDTDQRNLVNSRVWVHCSCEDFTYRHEVPVTLRKSSSIIDSNGGFPHINNPQARPMLCKHLAALARLAPTAPAKPITDIGDVTPEEIEVTLRKLGPLLRSEKERDKRIGKVSPTTKSPKGLNRLVKQARNR